MISQILDLDYKLGNNPVYLSDKPVSLDTLQAMNLKDLVGQNVELFGWSLDISLKGEKLEWVSVVLRDSGEMRYWERGGDHTEHFYPKENGRHLSAYDALDEFATYFGPPDIDDSLEIPDDISKDDKSNQYYDFDDVF